MVKHVFLYSDIGRFCSEFFSDCGLKTLGISLIAGSSEQAAKAAVRAALKRGDTTLVHDKNGAPHIEGTPERLLISITDEKEWSCAAAVSADGSKLRGIGIDLASTEDFNGGHIGEIMSRRFLTEGEQRAVARVSVERRGILRTAVFSAREAAFKALSSAAGQNSNVVFSIEDFDMVWGSGAGGSAIPCGKAGSAFKMCGGGVICFAALLSEEYVFSAAKFVS
jgi:phosphopantetheinyl transferase (holo-ACP synthase)